jgi:hypothetical protein
MRIPGKSEYTVTQWVKMWRGANTELGGHHAAWVKLVKFLINDGISYKTKGASIL